ncbi:MAG TPA: hypothetical protein PK665_14595 [Ignavibacteriaceae bacterium]|nr:hypothetical protein [Ignavibacteriaceae bacterium]
MKILEKEDLKTPEDLAVVADFVRHQGKLYKKGEVIKQVAGNDKAILVATKKAEIKVSK